MAAKDNEYEVTDHCIEIMPGAPDKVSIEKEDILEGRGFILYNILTPEECAHYSGIASSLGMEPVAGQGYRKEYRNNDRVVAKGEDLAQFIWERVKQYIPQTVDMLDDPSLDRAGVWQASGLNEVFRICRYHPGGHFSPHCDGVFRRNTSERSFLTFMLYLNSDYDGGSTNFLKDSAQHTMQQDGHYCAAEEDVILRVQPKQGMALCFYHDLLHEGGQLKNGEKWIMRTEVMYKRVQGPEMTEKEKAALDLLAKAQDLETAGELTPAMECYRKAFKMCPELEKNY